MNPFRAHLSHFEPVWGIMSPKLCNTFPRVFCRSLVFGICGRNWPGEVQESCAWIPKGRSRGSDNTTSIIQYVAVFPGSIFPMMKDSKQPWVGPRRSYGVYGPMYKTPRPKPSMAPHLFDQLEQSKPENWTWWSMGWIYHGKRQEKDSHTDVNQNVATSTSELVSAVDDKMWEEHEIIIEKPQDPHEEMIKTTREILKRFCGEARRSHHPVMGRSHKSYSKHAKARNAEPSRVSHWVNVEKLRYSQLTCGQYFQCGRSVEQLVQDLLKGRVKLFAPFLKLTVFETTDSNDDPILKCIDNRRLLALKLFAATSGRKVMVNVDMVSLKTLSPKQAKRIMRNCDDTDGHHVILRASKPSKKIKNADRVFAGSRSDRCLRWFPRACWQNLSPFESIWVHLSGLDGLIGNLVSIKSPKWPYSLLNHSVHTLIPQGSLNFGGIYQTMMQQIAPDMGRDFAPRKTVILGFWKFKIQSTMDQRVSICINLAHFYWDGFYFLHHEPQIQPDCLLTKDLRGFYAQLLAVLQNCFVDCQQFECTVYTFLTPPAIHYSILRVLHSFIHSFIDLIPHGTLPLSGQWISTGTCPMQFLFLGICLN